MMLIDDDIKTRIHSAFQALSAGDPRPYLDLLADDIVWKVTGKTSWSGIYRGKRALITELLRPVSERIEGQYKASVVQVLVEGDRVVVETKGHNVTCGGMRYDNEYCWVCRTKDGRLVEVTEYADTELFTSALGADGPRAATF